MEAAVTALIEGDKWGKATIMQTQDNANTSFLQASPQVMHML